MKEPFCYIGIDIGGTWIKGSCFIEENSATSKWEDKLLIGEIKKVKSPLNELCTIEQLTEVLKQLIQTLNTNGLILRGIGISTAGIVDYAGKQILKAAGHLTILKNSDWIKNLKDEYKCPIVLINDADATSIGIAELGFLKGNKTVGIMPIGTGLGFAVWRNGRRWRPGKMLNLLGSIRTPVGLFDGVASASKLAAADSENNLINVLTYSSFKRERENYINNLVNVINTAAIFYNLDEVIICGGLAEAAASCNFPLQNMLNSKLEETPLELNKSVRALVLKEGNSLQLIGAISLARGEAVAFKSKVSQNYNDIKTEIPYQKDIQLQKLSTSDLVNLFWKAEQEAGVLFEKNLPIITKVVDSVAERLTNGGRLIYVGAGTSGRIAAMDSVEIPCTYGFPEDRILCLIAGGVADAAIEIESDFEEDASAIPEMLLLNIKPQDVVIGISASGTAYYVQSALAFAKHRGAFSVMIQSDFSDEDLPFCNVIIPMNSGNEVVAGSTRMKAGTATKKILNFISSSVMIKMGKVAGSYMIDVACINNKLIDRAENILSILFDLNKQESFQELKKADMQLSKAIENLT